MTIKEDWDNWKGAKDSFIINLTVGEQKILLNQSREEILNECRKELDKIKVMTKPTKEQPYTLIAYADVMVMFDDITKKLLE